MNGTAQTSKGTTPAAGGSRPRLFAYSSWRDVDWRGTDLTGAQFTCVDLTGADLRDARLDDAMFRHVIAPGARFSGASARRSFFEHADLSGCDFSRTTLCHVVLKQSTASGAMFDDADLSDAAIVGCNCDGASLRGAQLSGLITPDSTFRGAQLHAARRFWRARELVVEVLRQAIGDDPERVQVVGAVALQRAWCYPEWAQMLRSRPYLLDEAIEVFEDHPASGMAVALRAARMTTR
jgi:uncharacterized protein YjbI with pentapeptide repeats